MRFELSTAFPTLEMFDSSRREFPINIFRAGWYSGKTGNSRYTLPGKALEWSLGRGSSSGDRKNKRLVFNFVRYMCSAFDGAQ
jgi:hypothetical protein